MRHIVFVCVVISQNLSNDVGLVLSTIRVGRIRAFLGTLFAGLHFFSPTWSSRLFLRPVPYSKHSMCSVVWTAEGDWCSDLHARFFSDVPLANPPATWALFLCAPRHSLHECAEDEQGFFPLHLLRYGPHTNSFWEPANKVHSGNSGRWCRRAQREGEVSQGLKTFQKGRCEGRCVVQICTTGTFST